MVSLKGRISRLPKQLDDSKSSYVTADIPSPL